MAKKSHSPKFEYYKEKYEKGHATEEQHRRLVRVNVLTPEEFEEITGDKYDE